MYDDETIPIVLKAAREAGAQWAFMGLVRLVPSVAAVFETRLRAFSCVFGRNCPNPVL